MPSFISELLSKFYPNEEGRLLCVGLDASGRTSWLYCKRTGEVVTTIPTIGFNVETITHGGLSMTVWDVGGCDKIRPLWRHYFQNTHGIVLFVDANDRDRMDEVRNEVLAILESPELEDAFWLVIANKQDLPKALSPEEVSERLQLPDAMAGRLWTCLPGALGDRQAQTAHFDWLAAALRHSLARGKEQHRKPREQHPQRRSGSKGASGPVPAASASAAAPATGTTDGDGPAPDILERWLQVEDEPDEEFLRKLEDYSLESWDHRTHLRLAWLYLTRLGRREGLARIHASIRAFIEHSPITRRRSGTTYHETMTYFWAHMVHFAMASQKLPEGATPDFKLFLLMNPQLTNGGLFLHYYTKQLMLQTPEARVRVVMPDKRPLPSIITDLGALRNRAAATTTSTAPSHPPPPNQSTLSRSHVQLLTDSEFLDRFMSRSMDRWNHECLLRAVYCCLKRHGRRRGGDVALEALRALQGRDFHLTICYFWVCILTHTLASEFHAGMFAERQAAVASEGADNGRGNAGPEATMPEWPQLLGGEGYTSVRLKELVADDRRYLRYYSTKVVFSEAAAAEFVPPDKRPLPSTV